MPDADKLTSADLSDLADSLAYALRFQGRKRVHNADEIMAEIVSKRPAVEFPAKRLYSQRRNNRDVRSVHEEHDVVVTEAEQSIRPL